MVLQELLIDFNIQFTRSKSTGVVFFIFCGSSSSGDQIKTVEGEPQDIKITTHADLERANWILKSMSNS